ncbi:MAG TPA: response regulator, partial [Candidatus Limnocylindrales bacterium]
MRVLVVEDEPVNRALLRAVFSRAREQAYAVDLTEAVNLAAARQALRDAHFDVIILDVRLPDGNGLDLARELAAARGDARPKVLIMSASVLKSDRDAAITAGGDAFLP